MTSIEKSVESVAKLIKNNIPHPVIIFALRQDGFTLERSLIIIRWAEMMIKNESSEKRSEGQDLA